MKSLGWQNMTQLNQDVSQRSDQWEPSFNARTTLKQLGINESQLRRSLIEYRRISTHPSDREYQVFVIDQTNIHFPTLNIDWYPNTNTLKILDVKGYSQIVINHYVDLFVLKIRESRAVLIEPNAAFLAFILNTCSIERTDQLSKAIWMHLALSGLSPSEIGSALRKITEVTAMSAADIPQNRLVELIISLRD
jgi:hypothetical protein